MQGMRSKLVTAAAVLWWWRTYGEVVTYGYLSWPEAGQCLVRDSDICMLAKALCLGSHPQTFLLYWTSAFWSGVGQDEAPGALSSPSVTNSRCLTLPSRTHCDMSRRKSA